MTHMDTVPLCAGAKPKCRARIVNEAKTALGGDNRSGCAVLVTLAAELAKQKLPHPPITLLFTVREESGLFGAKHLNPADLGGPVVGFNFDGRRAADVIIGAIGADRWTVDIHGKASHAGVAPEKGIFDHDPRAGDGGRERRRVVRQGGEGQAAGDEQRRTGRRRDGRPPATRPTSSPTTFT